jgi:Cyclic nucleotide-binding domain
MNPKARPKDDAMRIESSVTSVSWIPLGAVQALPDLAFASGVAHYDPPPPDQLQNPEGLLASDGARFINELRAFIEVEDGRITAHGHLGGGHIGSTTLRLAAAAVTFPGAAFPDLRPEPQVGDGWVRFSQTTGGRTGVATPHLVRRRPFVQLAAPAVWTTLSLTIHADGRSDFQLVGASPFPRHWLYDHTGRLVAKSGLIDFPAWYRQSFGQHTPWGGEQSPALVTAVESALERELSAVMIGSHPPFVRLQPGEHLVEQGEPGGGRLFLLFDGVLLVLRDGRPLTEVGPGAILGEMALVEGGRRTATLQAVTPCRVAVVPGDRVDRSMLEQVANHRHDQPTA